MKLYTVNRLEWSGRLAGRHSSGMVLQVARGVQVFLVACGLFFVAFVQMLNAAPAAFQEYEVKAAFLYNFVRFVDWPASAFADAGAAVTIGVLGDDPFGELLEQAVTNETVKGRKFVVRRFHDVESVGSCHVLFVSKSEKNRLPFILQRLRDAPILTVGETEGFAAKGGIVNFFIERNKVRFEINQQSALQRGLKISSQLLCLGRIVPEETNKERH